MCVGLISLFRGNPEHLTSMEIIEALIVFLINFAVDEGLPDNDASDIYHKLMYHYDKAPEDQRNWFVDAIIDKWACQLIEDDGEA